MAIYSIAQARNGFSQLVTEALAGAEVLISNRGKPVARLEPLQSRAPHTGAAFAAWLADTELPDWAVRPPSALEAQIAESRESWTL